MSGRHIITLAELDECLRRPQWLTFAKSYSSVSQKVIQFDGTASAVLVFRVTDHGETKFLGTDKDAAVAAYNDAP